MEIDKNLKIKLTRKDKIADGILAAIALKGPKCFDDLYYSPPRALGSRRKLKEREELGSKGAVHSAFEHLKKCKLIRFHEKIEKAEKYNLTLPGLLVALSIEPIMDQIDRVVEHHEHKLPLILGKWNLFVDVKADNIVKERMKEYLSRPPEIVHISPYHLLIYGLEKKDKKEREFFMRKLINEKFELHLQEDINRAVLFPWIFGIVYDFYVPKVNIPDDEKVRAKIKVTDDMEKWISILLLDPKLELKSYLINELDHLEKYGDFCSEVAKIYKLFINKYPLYFYSGKRKLSHTN
jgi:hypothetical protein